MTYAQSKPGTTFKSAPGVLYYLQRLAVRQWMRKLVVAAVGAKIRRRMQATGVPGDAAPGDARSLNTLRKLGYTPLPTMLGARQVEEMLAFLEDKKVVDRRNHGRSFLPTAVPEGVPLADYTMQDILACPHVVALANHPQLLRLAHDYIGCKPTISAIMLRWSFPNDAPGAGVQAFHRDSDDWRFLKIFVYLTDVDEAGGPHVYVRGSHLSNCTFRLHTFSDQAIADTYGDAALVVTGKRGFAFAADTYGIHKGMVPVSRPRLLLQIQYSLLPVYAYEYQPEPYLGTLPLDPYINRLILKSA